MDSHNQKYVYEAPVNMLDMSENNQLDQTRWPANVPQSNKNLIRIPPKKVAIWNILFPQFTVKSVTFVLSLLMFIYYWIYYIYQSQNDSLEGCSLYEFGAKFTPAIRFQGIVLLKAGHFHRLLVSIPLYGSILHTCIGTLTIQMFGYVAETKFGHWKYILIMALSGYMSNVWSALIYEYRVTVGSYGILYGILMIYGNKLITSDLGVYKKLVWAIYTLIFLINIVPIVGSKYIDVACIVGAIIQSALVILYFQDLNTIRHGKIIHYTSLLLAVLLLVLMTLGIFLIDVEDVRVEKWC